jgi:hypothetical protein
MAHFAIHDKLEQSYKVDICTMSKYTLLNVIFHDLKICKRYITCRVLTLSKKIFKCFRIVLLCDIISSSILWRMKQMLGESAYQAL